MTIKLRLGGELNNWEKFKARKGNPKFLEIRSKIVHRDREKCCFCGYSGETLEVINYDNNYKNNTPANLITACVFCTRCTLLDYYKLDYIGGDRIIFLPELSQAQLNTLCQILFCETAADSPADHEGSYNAKSILAQLLDRANFLDDQSKCQLSHPGLFLHYLNSDSAKPEFVKKLRWLPDPNEYQEAIKIWAEEAHTA